MAFKTTVCRSSVILRFFRKGNLQNRSLLPVIYQWHTKNASLAAHHSSPVVLRASIFVDQALAAATEAEAKTIQFPLRHVEFTTCRTPDVQSSSASGLKFKAAYIDTNPDADASVPTIFAVHGVPGSHLDFKHLINFLPKQNMRVISVNFPGCNWTPMDSEDKFMHTAVEKTSFLVDFLDAIKVSKVDVLAAHSAGTYPSVLLCTNTNLIRSLLLVNPMGHRFMKSLNPWWYYSNHRKFCRIPLLRPLLLLILKLRLIAIKFPSKDAILTSVQIETMTKLDYKQHQQTTSLLTSKKFPVFMMYSERDPLVEPEISAEYALMLGGTPDLMQYYDAEGKLVRPIKGKGDRIFRGFVFKKGGHFLLKRYPDIINQAVLDLHNAVNKKEVP